MAGLLRLLALFLQVLLHVAAARPIGDSTTSPTGIIIPGRDAEDGQWLRPAKDFASTRFAWAITSARAWADARAAGGPEEKLGVLLIDLATDHSHLCRRSTKQTTGGGK